MKCLFSERLKEAYHAAITEPCPKSKRSDTLFRCAIMAIRLGKCEEEFIEEILRHPSGPAQKLSDRKRPKQVEYLQGLWKNAQIKVDQQIAQAGDWLSAVRHDPALRCTWEVARYVARIHVEFGHKGSIIVTCRDAANSSGVGRTTAQRHLSRLVCAGYLERIKNTTEVGHVDGVGGLYRLKMGQKRAPHDATHLLSRFSPDDRHVLDALHRRKAWSRIIHLLSQGEFDDRELADHLRISQATVRASLRALARHRVVAECNDKWSLVQEEEPWIRMAQSRGTEGVTVSAEVRHDNERRQFRRYLKEYGSGRRVKASNYRED